MIWIGICASALFVGIMLTYAGESQRYTMILPNATEGSTTSGYTIMLCHRRGRDKRRGQVRKAWSGQRADLVRRWRGDIGFASYVQVHRVSRLSLTYNLILASR